MKKLKGILALAAVYGIIFWGVPALLPTANSYLQKSATMHVVVLLIAVVVGSIIGLAALVLWGIEQIKGE